MSAAMSPAHRESLRALLNETGTPEHALARKLIGAVPVFAFDLDHPLSVDCCDVCSALNWRECACSPSESRAERRA